LFTRTKKNPETPPVLLDLLNFVSFHTQQQQQRIRTSIRPSAAVVRMRMRSCPTLAEKIRETALIRMREKTSSDCSMHSGFHKLLQEAGLVCVKKRI
jgi:hypothetical protein